MARKKKINPNRLEQFLSQPPKRLTNQATKTRMLLCTKKQSRGWLDQRYAEQKGHCAYCKRSMKRENATLDHIIPLARCGLHDLSNVCAACELCNSLKSDLEVSEFLVILAERKAREKAEMERLGREKYARENKDDADE